MQVQHPVADWYLAFDDLWELMRVNWQTHNPFTQSGMWNAGEYEVQGISLIVDRPPHRGVLLQIITPQHEPDFMVVVTYGPKCNECGYTPYNALCFGDGGFVEAADWAMSAILDMFNNAEESGVEKRHEAECSCLRYPDDDDEPTGEWSEAARAGDRGYNGEL